MSERMSDEHEVTEQLITFLRGRSEHGQRKYGVALKPFDGRNTTFDALEEATDLSQYLMKRVMENEAIADLLDRASDILEWFENYYPGEVNTYFANPNMERKPIGSGRLFDMAARLRADCERSVPVDDMRISPVSPDYSFMWAAQMEGES